MNDREIDMTLARRELVLVSVLLVAIARLVDRPDAFLAVGLLPAVVLIAGVSVIRAGDLPGRPVDALIVPAVLTGGAGAALHLVPPGLGLLPALLVFAFGLDRLLAFEMRLLAQAAGTSDADRSRILVAVVITAFVAFTGMAALVPGGLPELGGSAGTGGGLTEVWLLVLAMDDALIALLLGYRVSAARYGSMRDAVRSAFTYAVVIAIAAGALRAMEVPQLVGPAALTLVFYLWDALHATAPARRREPRFLWETILLAVLAVVVVAWNLRLRA